MKAAAIAITAAALLAGCSLFGSDKPEQAAVEAGDPAEVVKKDCSDPRWKEQNLGLWYSVCRPPLRW
jgi:hypothetical protein